MKKTVMLTVAALLLVGLPAATYAQGEVIVGAKLGYAEPTGDFGEDFDGGFVYGFFGEVAYSHWLSFEGTLARHTHDEGEEGLGELFPINLQMSMFPGIDEEDFGGEKKLTIVEAAVNAKFYFPVEGFRPYLTAGVGAYFWDFDVKNLGDHTETDFGINGGGGVLFPVTERVYLGADLRYTRIYTQIAADEQSLTFWDLTGLIAYGF